MDIKNIRHTTNNKLARGTRLMLAVIFLMTGPMKLLVPELAEAWSGQLLAAQLPLYEITKIAIPYLELFLGIVLAVGYFTRPSVVIVIGIMIAATYVHLIVGDPSLFPLQPKEPIIPVMVIIMSIYNLKYGAGASSMDLTESTTSI